MPQPLSRLVKPGEHIKFTPELPHDNPALCAQAMQVIAQWGLIERDAAVLVVTFTLGRGASISDLINSSRAESPKAAIRNALAAALLLDDELPVFTVIMKRYETAYKLRNPLAHWTLGHSPQAPNAIVAVDPTVFIATIGKYEDDIDKMFVELRADGPVQDRLSPETQTAVMAAYQNYTDEMLAYRSKDFEGILKTLGALLTMLRYFRYAIRARQLNKFPEIRARTLQTLNQQLELSQPKEG